MSAAGLGAVSAGVGEVEPVPHSQCAGGHFSQSPLDKFLLVLSAPAVEKKLFSCTSLDRKLAKKTQQCFSSIEAAEIQERYQGARRESSSLLPAP